MLIGEIQGSLKAREVPKLDLKESEKLSPGTRCLNCGLTVVDMLVSLVGRS